MSQKVSSYFIGQSSFVFRPPSFVLRPPSFVLRHRIDLVIKKHLLLLTAYTAIALVMSYPLALNLTTAIPGVNGDMPSFVWALGWMKSALELGVNPFRTDYVFYPLGGATQVMWAVSLIALLAIPLQTLFGLIATYNLLYLAATVLTAWGMFVLVEEVLQGRVFSVQCSVSRGQGSGVSGQRSAVSGRRSAVGGQQSAFTPHASRFTLHASRFASRFTLHASRLTFTLLPLLPVLCSRSRRYDLGTGCHSSTCSTRNSFRSTRSFYCARSVVSRDVMLSSPACCWD
ncbi:MAG: hypothetical protein N2559_15490 [Anaerolineae bacterium]|nr:hypothetical protein [Anaerolineae bacterium]